MFLSRCLLGKPGISGFGVPWSPVTGAFVRGVVPAADEPLRGGGGGGGGSVSTFALLSEGDEKAPDARAAVSERGGV